MNGETPVWVTEVRKEIRRLKRRIAGIQKKIDSDQQTSYDYEDLDNWTGWLHGLQWCLKMWEGKATRRDAWGGILMQTPIMDDLIVIGSSAKPKPRDLIIRVKQKYFDQIANDEKTEEYRLRKPYWIKRIEGKTFDRVVIVCGYIKGGLESGVWFPWNGYTIKTIQHPEFGPVPVEVIAIPLIDNYCRAASILR